MSKLVVIGDVGGHLEELEKALNALHVDTLKGVIPEDLIICQVGDLIHRGPDSLGVLLLVDKLLKNNPGQWIQLAGNHEAQYLFTPRFSWPEQLEDTGKALLRKWWAEDKMKLAAGFKTKETTLFDGSVLKENGLLITHAGLTSGLWTKFGRLSDAHKLADAINKNRFESKDKVWRGGVMIEGTIDYSAGVVWAACVDELYTSWLMSEEEPRFNQAHGHSTPVHWTQGTLDFQLSQWRKKEIAPEVKMDFQKRLAFAKIYNQTIFSCDPAHSKFPAKKWEPLILNLISF